MKNLKIGKKLLITFGCIILLFLATVIVATLGMNRIGDNFDGFYKQGYTITHHTMLLRRNIQAAGKFIGYACMSPSASDTQAYINDCQAALDDLNESALFLQKNYSGDQTPVTNLINLLNSSVAIKDQVFQNALDLENDQASTLYFDSYMPILLEANDYVMAINDAASAEADNEYAIAHTTQLLTTVTLLILAAVALLITLVLAGYVTRSLVRPIKEIEAAATGMAQGNLDVTVTYTSRDELGVLAEKIRTLTNSLKTVIADEGYLLSEMANGNFDIRTRAAEYYVGSFNDVISSIRLINGSLSSTLSQINDAANQVSSSSDQVSGGAQMLSQGATEQASSVEELASTLTEISLQVEENAKNTDEVRAKVNSVGGEVVESNKRMQNMLTAMDEISKSSQEISKIIKTIEDIAFQTNILALNAAVEAARAGSAGKGFAVVADEVRNLASKSSEASKNTAALIEASLRAVENGTHIAKDTAGSLVSVVDGAQVIEATVDKIAIATEAQARAVEQVTTGIEQISGVVQTNSATAEESAAASEELSGQAQVLKTLVNRFRLRADNQGLSTQYTPTEVHHPASVKASTEKY